MNIQIPKLALVVLVGASGSGKSSFARKHFLPTEVVSSDHCRALVADDETVLDANDDAFALLHTIAGTRLKRRRLTVVDATNVHPESRRPLVQLARDHDCPPVAIVLDIPQRVCEERNALRPDRNFGSHVVRNHVRALRQSLGSLEGEGFRHVFVLRSPEAVDAATVERALESEPVDQRR
jgi:protein phosphatase